MADVAKVILSSKEESVYPSITSAFNAVDNGSTVILLEDVSASKVQTISSALYITLDLNGYTYTAPKAVFGIIEGAYLEIIDSSVAASGKIISTGGSAIQLGSSSDFDDKNTVTLNSGTIESQEFGVSIFGGGVANVNGGTVIAKDNGAIGCNGSAKYAEYPCEINITGGTLIAKTETEGYANCGVYAANAGTVKVSGGTIIGESGAGIVVRGGSVQVTGGIIEGRGTSSGLRMGDANPTYCGGIEICNAANYPGKMGTVSISGGEISSVNASAVLVIGDPSDSSNPNAKDSKVAVMGGEFNGKESAIGFVTKSGEDIEDTSKASLVVSGGSFNSDVSSYLDSDIKLTKVYDLDGNVTYVIKNELDDILNNTQLILDTTYKIDYEVDDVEAYLETLNTTLNDSKSILKNLKNISSDIYQKVKDIPEDFENVEDSLNTIKTDFSNLLNDTETIKEVISNIDSTSNKIKSTTDGIKADTDSIKSIDTLISSKLDTLIDSNNQIVSLDKKILAEIAKLLGEDPSELIEDERPKTKEGIELLQIQSLIGSAKASGETRVIWNHPMTEVVETYCKSNGYTISEFTGTNIPAKFGSQWLIIIPE